MTCRAATAVMALLLAGCSSDSNDADDTFTTVKATLVDGQLVWDAGAVLRLYDADSPFFDRCQITSGAGSQTALFTRPTGDQSHVKKAGLAAGPDAMVRLVGYTEEGLQMQFTLPDRYGWIELAPVPAGEAGRANCLPLWGTVTSSGGYIQSQVHFLSGILRIDRSRLPEGSVSLTLSTSDSGFPLAGRFAAIVSKASPENSVLEPQADSFVYQSVVTVTLPAGSVSDESAFIPIPAGRYPVIEVACLLEDQSVRSVTLKDLSFRRGEVMPLPQYPN